VGVSLFIQGAAYLLNGHDLGFVTLVVSVLTIAGGALLLVGYLTPLACVVSALFCIGNAFSWFPAPSSDFFEGKLAAALAIVITLALICLGPGAFSLDAHLFGRREIIIHDSSHTP
jgi:uncharacterized membrane protein YphA (DoxX/SURF4 family)